MLPERLDRLIRPVTLLALVVFCVACQLIANPTKDKGGAEGAVSWIFFVGFWVGLVAILLVLARLVTRRRQAAR